MWRLYYLYFMWITWNWVSKCASENAISLILTLSLNSPKFFNLPESISAKMTILYWQYPAFWTIPEESKQWESSSKNEQSVTENERFFKHHENFVKFSNYRSTYSTDCLSGWSLHSVSVSSVLIFLVRRAVEVSGLNMSVCQISFEKWQVWGYLVLRLDVTRIFLNIFK